MKFKVGDKVAVYEGYQDRKTGVVQKPMYTSKDINTDNPQYFSVLLDKEWGYGCTYHYKQCRNLVKKKTNTIKEILSTYDERLKKLEDTVEKLISSQKAVCVQCNKPWDYNLGRCLGCDILIGKCKKCGNYLSLSMGIYCLNCSS